MKLSQCSRKHYFDGDKFAECPYCTGATGAFSLMQSSQPESETKGMIAGEIARDTEYYPKTEILSKEISDKTEILVERTEILSENE